MTEDKTKTLTIIYQELRTSINQQMQDIEHINTKLSWVIVATTAFLGFVISGEPSSNLLFVESVTFITIALIFSISGLWTRKYNIGTKHENLLDDGELEEEKFLQKLTRTLSNVYRSNLITVALLSNRLKLSVGFLFAGIITILIHFFLNQ